MEATPRTNRSAKGGARSSLHYGGEGVLIHPSQQGVCGRHGTEDLSVTPGGLSGSAGGTEGSDPISASEMGSGVLGVVGRPNSTRSAAKATRPGAWRQSVSGKAQRLHERVHSGQYWPKPVRRTYIPKSDGGRRPLGIPALEDKIVQGAVAEVR